MRDYPVQVDIHSPARFDRIQLLIRLALGIVLAWFGITAGWLACVLYGTLPLIAAIALSSIGTERYLADFAPRLWRVLAWLLQLSAFMALLVDRFPTAEEGDVVADLRLTGRPTLGSALVRLVTSIPSGLVLGVLACVAGVLCVISYATVLVGEHVPRSILAYQRGVLRWQARLVAYHASLVEEYPPFSFDTEPGAHLDLPGVAAT